MGNESDEIERHIENQRNQLGENMSELQDKVKSAVDWRAQFEERPLTMISLAFGGGVLLSTLLPSIPQSNGRKRSTSLQRISEDNGSNSYASPGYTPEVLRPGKKSETWQKASATLNGVKGALFAVAASKVTNYLEEMIPGFNEQFRKWESNRT